MRVWRLFKKGRAPFDGKGSRLYGGRWNRPGVDVVYTSATLSLATLEMLVHVDLDLIPRDVLAVSGEIPADLAIRSIEPGSLPRDWRAYPAPESLVKIGTEWVAGLETAVLAVPSVLVPSERNYLLNPAHPDFRRIRIEPHAPFTFDRRLLRTE